MTFADFAVTEARFRKHFKAAPPGSWNDNMVPLHEFLDMGEPEREERYPYIWGVNAKNRLTRIMVSETLVRTTEDRRDFWRQLKDIMPVDSVVDVDRVTQQVRSEIAQQITSNLLGMLMSGDLGAITGSAAATIEAPQSGGGQQQVQGAPAAESSEGDSDFEPLWIDTPECDGCEECIKINPKIFVFNADNKAEVLNPKAGTFKDIVRAAEKCTVSCIHPGTPWNASEPDVDKLIQRAAAFQ